MKMAALAKLNSAPGLWMTEAPVPSPGPEEVLIRVRRTAICGTDLHIYNWDEWAAATIPVPMIVGHEFAGEIVELGTRVSRRLKPGDRVSAEGHIIDPDSTAARTGRFHLDPGTIGVGVNRQGAFAEYLCVPAFNVVPLPDDVSFDIGALLDPLGNAMHTAQQFDLLGRNVLITGAGPIGIMAAAIVRRAGARAVIVTDTNRYRLGLARRLGATRIVDVTSEELRDVMAEEGIEDGFDVAMEMSGAPSAIEQAVDTLAMGGGLAMLGIPARPMPVLWSRIILKALTIRGVYGREMFGSWHRMLALLHAGLDLKPIITHRRPAAEFQAAFDTARSGMAGKVILEW